MESTPTHTPRTDEPQRQSLQCDAIKTLLVPVSGSETDRVVFGAAWTVAQPLQAHMEFMHLRLKPHEAARHSPEAMLRGGSSVRDALGHLVRQQDNLSASAANYVKQFCLEHSIPFSIQPSATGDATAEFLEESAQSTATLLRYARRSDLTVLGRPQHADCLPRTLTEEVLMNSGRPLLIVPKSLPWPLLGTVVVGWKESAASARAVAAALPLLRLARRVVVVNVAEDNQPGLEALASVRAKLAWHGITAEVQRIGDGIVEADGLLRSTMRDMKAGLLVVGGFGHSRQHERVFGGVTRSLVKSTEFPLFIAH